MKIDLDFVHLTTPLFFKGINWGDKIYADPKKNPKGEIQMWYDTDLKLTVFLHKGEVTMVQNAASMDIRHPEQLGLSVINTTPVEIARVVTPPTNVKAQASGPGLDIKRTAQVETPLDKVQGGVKTIRRAKFQGEESP